MCDLFGDELLDEVERLSGRDVVGVDDLEPMLQNFFFFYLQIDLKSQSDCPLQAFSVYSKVCE